MSTLIVSVFHSADEAHMAADSVGIQSRGVKVIGITERGAHPASGSFASLYPSADILNLSSHFGANSAAAYPAPGPEGQWVLRLTCEDREEDDIVRSLAQLGADKISVRH